MTINGIDYRARSTDLAARGIEPFSADDTAFGAEVYCNQHRAVHPTGWCAVSNIEKFSVDEMAKPGEVVHRCPEAAVTPCCGRTPFELPPTSRMTLHPALVTCSAPVVPSPDRSQP